MTEMVKLLPESIMYKKAKKVKKQKSKPMFPDSEAADEALAH